MIEPKIRAYNIEFARREIEPTYGFEITDTVQDIVRERNLRLKTPSMIGASLLTSAMASRLVIPELDNPASYRAKLKRTIRDIDGADEPIFAQLGGAMLVDDADHRDGIRHLVAMEIISGSEELNQESSQLLAKLAPGLMLDHNNRKRHITIAKSHNLEDAVSLAEGLNDSDIPSAWVGLSSLEATKTRRNEYWLNAQ